MPRVFVSGIGFITSIGNDVSTVEQNLRELRHGIEAVPAMSAAKNSPIHLLGTVKEFDCFHTDWEDWTFPERYRTRREVMRGMSPHAFFSYCAAAQAIANAGMEPADLANETTGLFTASSGCSMVTHQQIARIEQMGPMRNHPLGVVQGAVGTVTFNLDAALGIKGASCGFASACASSGHALGFALDALRIGRQKRILVVGAEDGDPMQVLSFAAMRALSPSQDPDTASRPFDAKRDGFVGTGGATALILETEEALAERGGTATVELAGWGQASDGYNVAQSHPEGDGLSRAIELCLRDAGLAKEEIDYVNAHATSTPIGDISEIRALKHVFGDQPGPALSSTKALTGHGLSLASAMEAGFVVLGMERGFTPGSAHVTEPDPELGQMHLLQETLSTPPTVALSNSSGFGGANVCLAFRRNAS